MQNEQVTQQAVYEYSDAAMYSGIAQPCDSEIQKSILYKLGRTKIISHHSVSYNDCNELIDALGFRPISAAIYA